MTQGKQPDDQHNTTLGQVTPRALPVFEGYTIDLRLRELRKLNRAQPPVFLSFESDEGDEILGRYIETLSRKEFRAFLQEYCL